jgi:putative alpha-1,2-mannosidase
MAIGLFQVRGGCEPNPIYEITSPLFNQITIHLPNDKTFTIKAVNNRADNIYIQSAELNGEPLQNAYFRHSDFTNRGTLTLILGPEPNKSWGSENPPPSMSNE